MPMFSSSSKVACLAPPPPSNSAASLDLGQLLAENSYPRLLSETASLESLELVSPEGVPPFPLGCMVPMSTIIGIRTGLPKFTKGHRAEGLPDATTTVPTPPRLRTMLKEPLCVSRWANTLVAADAPGHTPWGEDLGKTIEWRPEGSVYPPDEFREALCKARGRTALTKTSTLASRRQSHRDALVFEREISLLSDSDGKKKRWSVQVPATSMDPETVNMMLELRGLNAFFQSEIHPETTPHLVPPSLVLSNSHTAIPLSLESSGNLNTGEPPTLASRRGLKVLPTLTFNDKIDDDPYPGIPTAFLGSPSTYSPKFEFADGSAQSMDLHDMVGDLRSRCASLQSKSPARDLRLIEEDKVSEWSNHLSLPLTPTTASSGEDDWAFTDSLTREPGDETFAEDCHEQGEMAFHVADTSAGDSSLDTTKDFDSSLDHTLVSSPEPAVKYISTDTCEAFTPPDMATLPLEISSFKSLPPSSPLPPCPALRPSSQRGILKMRKSVRFAPAEDQETPSKAEKPLPTLAPRHSTASPAIASLKRPSPLRQTFSTKSKVTPSISDVTSLPRKSLIKLGGAPSLEAAGRQRPLTMIPVGGTPAPPALTPTSSPPSKLRRSTAGILSRSPQRQSVVDPEPVDSPPKPTSKKAYQTASLGRHSLGRLMGSGEGKENKLKYRASLSPSSFVRRSRLTFNENTFRREDGGGENEKNAGAQKSRMPVPLRNILNLTRFK